MSDSTYANFLFNFGSVYVYEAKSDSLFGKTSLYYWRYKDTASYHGPFKSIMECTRHWEESTRPPPVPPDMSNVIKVDFILKRRIK